MDCLIEAMILEKVNKTCRRNLTRSLDCKGRATEATYIIFAKESQSSWKLCLSGQKFVFSIICASEQTEKHSLADGVCVSKSK